MRVRYGVSFVSAVSCVGFVAIIVVLCVIQWCIGTHYNGIRLYMYIHRKDFAHDKFSIKKTPFTIDSPQVAHEGEIWCVFCWCSVLCGFDAIIVVLCVIPWYIGTHYNGIRLYMFIDGKDFADELTGNFIGTSHEWKRSHPVFAMYFIISKLN